MSDRTEELLKKLRALGCSPCTVYLSSMQGPYARCVSTTHTLRSGEVEYKADYEALGADLDDALASLVERIEGKAICG